MYVHAVGRFNEIIYFKLLNYLTFFEQSTINRSFTSKNIRNGNFFSA